MDLNLVLLAENINLKYFHVALSSAETCSCYIFFKVADIDGSSGFCSIKWLGEKQTKDKPGATNTVKTLKNAKPQIKARKEKTFLELQLDENKFLSSLKVGF